MGGGQGRRAGGAGGGGGSRTEASEGGGSGRTLRGGFTGLTTPNIPDKAPKIVRFMEVFWTCFRVLGCFFFKQIA